MQQIRHQCQTTPLLRFVLTVVLGQLCLHAFGCSGGSGTDTSSSFEKVVVVVASKRYLAFTQDVLRVLYESFLAFGSEGQVTFTWSLWLTCSSAGGVVWLCPEALSTHLELRDPYRRLGVPRWCPLASISPPTWVLSSLTISEMWCHQRAILACHLDQSHRNISHLA